MNKEMEDNLIWLIMAYAAMDDLDKEWWDKFKNVERVKITVDKLVKENKITEVDHGDYVLWGICGQEEE